MSKLKQFLLLAMIGLLSAFVVLSLAMNQIRQERQTQHYRQLNDLLHSTGLDYIETFDPFTETIDMDIGLYADGEGYGIVTASLAKEEVTGGEVQYSAVYPASTGDETIRVWYGICGTKAEPQLLLLLDEDEPRCRSLDIVGNRTTGQIETEETVSQVLTDLSGLPDDEHRIEVILHTAEPQEIELKEGFGLNDTIERTGREVYAAAQKIKETKKPYLTFSIDLTQALAETGW